MPHRARRWLKRILVGFVALLVTAVVTVLVLLHTDWGREQVRQRVLAAVKEKFPHCLRIDRIEGSVLGDLDLRGVEACDASGRPAITADRVRVNLGLLALFGGTIELDTLEVDRATVLAVVREGQPVNLSTVYYSDPNAAKSTWDVALPAVQVRDLDVTIDRDGTIEHLDDLSLDAAASLPADGPTAARLALSGVARERDRAALAVSAEVWSDERGVVVPAARLGLGDAIVEIDALTYRVPTPEAAGSLRGGLAVRAPAGELARVAPEAGLAAAIDAVAAADVALRPDAPGLHRAEGEVLITGNGAAAGIDLDRIDGGVWITDGVARLDARAVGDGRTEATAHAMATMEGDAFLVEDVKVEARIGSLAKASGGQLPVDGRARLDVEASARIEPEDLDLTVHATARADDLRADGIEVGHLFFDVRAAGEPRAMRGQARLEVTDLDRQLDDGTVQQLPNLGVTVKGGVSGPLMIDLDAKSRTWEADGLIGAQVTLAPPGSEDLIATIDLGSYSFNLPRTRVAGRGGKVVLEQDRLVVDGLRMRGSGATLALDATMGRGPREGQLDARMDLRKLDLARLRGVPGLPPALAGVVEVETDLRRRGRSITGEVEARATGLVVERGAIPVDLVVNADVAPRRLQLGVSAQGKSLGSLAATADVATPARLDDVKAWQRLERNAISELQVRARSLDVAHLQELTGQPPSLEGRLSAEVAMTRGRGTVALDGRGLVVPGAPAPLDLDVDLDLSQPAKTKVDARAALREIGDVSVKTAVAMPARPFDPAAWKRTDLRSLDAVDIVIHELELDEMRAQRLGVPGVRGVVAGTARIEPGLGPITLNLAGRDFLAGPLVTPATFSIDSNVERDRSRVSLEVALGGGPVMTGEVTVPVGLTRALAGDVDPAAVPLNGKVTIPEMRVARLMRALGRDQRLGGTLRGDVTIGGTVGDPTGRLAMIVEDLGARGRRIPDWPPGVRDALDELDLPTRRPTRAAIRRLTVDAQLADGKVHGEVKGKGVDGGDLLAIAEVDLAAPDGAAATIQATRFQLAPLARAVPEALLGVRGVLDADLQLRGLDPQTAQLSGALRVREAQAPLADAIGALREGTIDVSVRANKLQASVKGKVEAGSIDARATASLRGLLPDNGRLDVSFDDVSIISSTAPRVDGKLRVDVVRDGDHWKASARITDTEVVVPADSGRELHPTAPPADLVFTSDLRPGAEVPTTSASRLRAWLGQRPSKTLVDLQVVIRPVTVVSEQLRGTVAGRMQVAIGADGAAVDGRISVVNGRVLLFDRRYGIERADLVFDGDIDPLLDIQLAYEFPQLRMRVSLTGRLSKPELTLASDPNTYTEGELLSILLGSSPGSPGTPSDRSMTSVAATAAAQVVGGFFVSKLPVRIDVARYESVTAESSAAIVIGRWLTETTLVLLRTRLEPRPDENQNEVEVELWLTPRLLFEGMAGDRSVLGADLLWNKRW